MRRRELLVQGAVVAAGLSLPAVPVQAEPEETLRISRTNVPDGYRYVIRCPLKWFEEDDVIRLLLQNYCHAVVDGEIHAFAGADAPILGGTCNLDVELESLERRKPLRDGTLSG